MDSSIDLIIESKARELVEGFKVRRVLPSAKRRMVGPFVFFDEMGQEVLSASKGLDVAPHPHIGLATFQRFIPLPPDARPVAARYP